MNERSIPSPPLPGSQQRRRSRERKERDEGEGARAGAAVVMCRALGKMSARGGGRRLLMPAVDLPVWRNASRQPLPRSAPRALASPANP